MQRFFSQPQPQTIEEVTSFTTCERLQPLQEPIRNLRNHVAKLANDVENRIDRYSPITNLKHEELNKLVTKLDEEIKNFNELLSDPDNERVEIENVKNFLVNLNVEMKTIRTQILNIPRGMTKDEATTVGVSVGLPALALAAGVITAPVAFGAGLFILFSGVKLTSGESKPDSELIFEALETVAADLLEKVTIELGLNNSMQLK